MLPEREKPGILWKRYGKTMAAEGEEEQGLKE